MTMRDIYSPRPEAALAEARRVAGQPVDERLDGKQGEEAREIIIRLLEETGLDFSDAIKLVETYGWNRWEAGYQAARNTFAPRNEEN